MNVEMGLHEKNGIQVSHPEDGDRSCLISFMTKKYKCVILWVFSLLAVIEFFCLIIDKNYDDRFFEIFRKYVNNDNITNILF